MRSIHPFIWGNSFLLKITNVQTANQDEKLVCHLDEF